MKERGVLRELCVIPSDRNALWEPSEEVTKGLVTTAKGFGLDLSCRGELLTNFNSGSSVTRFVS